MGIATYNFDPLVSSPFVTGSVSSQFAAPPNDTTQYLSVGSPNRPGQVTIDFSGPISYFGFYLGSPDAYNSIAFYEHASDLNPINLFTGSQLLPPGNGNQSLGEYINFSVTGGSIQKIVLSSSQAALETDNHAFQASPVPEPASFGLAGVGVLITWFARRRMKHLN